MTTVSKLYKRLDSLARRIEVIIASKRFFYFTIILFVLFSLILAFTVSFGIGPDENFHLNYIKAFTEKGFSPFLPKDPEFAELNAIDRRPGFLYHYLMSFPFRLGESISWLPNHLPVRFVSVAIVTVNLFYIRKLITKMQISNFLNNLTIFILANTGMYLFLSHIVSYDHATNLLATLLFITAINLTQKITLKRLLAYALIGLTGMVVKLTFLPLLVFTTFSFGLLVLYRMLSKQLTFKLNKQFFKIDKSIVILGIFTLLSLGLFTERYVGNVLKYRQIKVRCDKVYSHRACLPNGIYKRSFTLERLRTADEFIVLEFVGDWIQSNHARTVGVVANSSYRAPEFIETTTLAMAAFGYFAIMRKSGVGIKSKMKKIRDSEQVRLALLATTIFYIYLIIQENYSAYHRTSTFGLGLQGRYLFPIIAVLIVLFAYYISQLKYFKEVAALRVSTALVAMVLIFLSGFPLFATKSAQQRIKIERPWFYYESIENIYIRAYDATYDINFLK